VTRAQELAESAVALARHVGNPVLIGYTLFGLCRAIVGLGDVERARPLAEEALAFGRDLGHRNFNAQVMLEQGRFAAAVGDEMQAAALWEESLGLVRKTQHQRAIAEILLELGRLAHRQGNDRQARAQLDESLRLYLDRGHRGFIAECLAALAGVSSSADARRAVRLFGAAAALRTAATVQARPQVHADEERDLATTREQLDEIAFARAWAAGQAMTLEQAIANALADEAGSEEAA
jgi:tetratricopeptide (TPR) repeat protein